MTEKHEVVLEARGYGPECTTAEREAIISRISFFSSDIVLLRELPVQTKFQIDLMFDEIERLTKSLSRFYCLVDLTEAQRPTASVRQHLRERTTKLENIKHIALFTEKNFLINMTAQFVFGTTTFRNFSIHKTKENALLAIKKIRDAANSPN